MTQAKIKTKETNLGECETNERLPSHRRACRNYQRCGYKIPRKQLADEYEGDCGMSLGWVCPECGAENFLAYKAEQRRKRLNFRPNVFDTARASSSTNINRDWKIPNRQTPSGTQI